ILFGLGRRSPDAMLTPSQVECSNNLLFEATSQDLAADDGSGRPNSKLVKEMLETWRFYRNWRDLSGTHSHLSVPPAEGGRRLTTKPKFVKGEPTDADFMRPVKDSYWANQGAGHTDPSLPTYVGAVPPPGVEPWDWERTWRARTSKKPK